jgi:ABC-type bacteriocin/lantibiotic exporter with double-glycine peptidase domain
LFVPPDQSAQLILAALPDGKLRVFDSGSDAETDIHPTSLAGEAFVFRTDDSNDKVLPEQQSWTKRLGWKMRYHIGLVFVLSIAGALLSLAVPMYVRFVYDTVLPSADTVMGAYMVLGVLALLGVDYLFRALKGKILAFISGRSDYILGNALFQRVINLPSSVSQGSSVSHQVSRIRKLARMRDLILGPLSLIFFEVPATVILLIAVGILNPYMLVVLLTSGFAFAALGYWSNKSGVRTAQKFGHLQVQRWEFLNQTLADMRTIRLAGSAQLWVDKFRTLSAQSIMASFRNNKEQAWISGMTRILGSATGLLGLATSAYLVITGGITGGTMVATMIILWRITGPVENLFMSLASFTEARDQLGQTDRLMRLKGESDIGVGKTHKVSSQGNLSFSRVSFRYASDADPVLLGVSFVVAPRQLLILTGGVGAGKSSLLKLIERTYSPQAGTIRLDGVDIRQIAINDLRSRFSYMPQQCQIFYGSIAQNILLVNPAASEPELHWAVEMTGLSVDIKNLPEGLNTRISDGKSEELPHGFRQRLSLARVMLKPASVVLLDEPGAGMDREGEDALLRCIAWLRQRSTIIMVSHRPGHMKLADGVLVMRQGSVIASGSFEGIKETIFAEMQR